MHKREKKERSFWWLILFAVIGGIVGMGVGSAEHLLQRILPEGAVAQWLHTYIVTRYTWLVAVVFAVVFPLIADGIFMAGFRRAKRQMDDDEDFADESGMDTGMGLVAVYTPISFVLFALAAKGLYTLEKLPKWEMLLLLVGFVGGMLLCGFLQKKMISCLKVLYPEKCGDVYSLRFQKDWVESMDEREKMELFNAAYHAYSTAQKLLFVVLIGTVVYSFSHEVTGWLFVVALLMLIPTVVYVHHAKK